ncbi:hypothetical protein J7E96_28415 [Streptomyces sp. ISL-96]|nr:hypothetical protein [Streptomyces sp. ISL-96]
MDQLAKIADGMTPRMTEALIFWGDRNPQGSTARTNLGQGGGTHGAVHRRGLIAQGRDARGGTGYYLSPLGWALYTHLTGKPRPADADRLTLAEALTEAYGTGADQAAAQTATRRVHRRACDFQPVTAIDADLVAGWTYRASESTRTRYGWVTTDGQVAPTATYVFRDWAAEGVHAARIAGADRAPAATPTDVERHDDVKVHEDGPGKWIVERGADFLGAIWDEGARMARGRYAIWSPYLPTAGFFVAAAPAVDAIVDAWPPSLADLVQETGAPLEVVAATADLLAQEQEVAAERVYRTAVRGAEARVTFEAAASIRETLGAPAARYAVAIGRDDRTWPRFHGRDRAVRHAASYGLTADAVHDSAPVPTA